MDQEPGRIRGYENIKGAAVIEANSSDFTLNHSPDYAQPTGGHDKEHVSAFLEAVKRVGGGEEFLLRVRRQQLLVQIAEVHLHEIEQMIRAYQEKKFDHFERLAGQYVADDESMENPIIRESALLRAMEHYIGPLVLSNQHSAAIQHAQEWVADTALQRTAPFAVFLDELSSMGHLDRAWREGLDLYLRIIAAVQSVRQVLPEWDPEIPDSVDIPGLVITGAADFDSLKSLYVDGYEFLARVLTLTTGLENIVSRGSHDAYLRHPTIKRFKPSSMADFHGRSNAPKLDYADSELSRNIANALEPTLRNGLGHYSAHFDRGSGMISYSGNAKGETTELPYGSFLLRLVRLAMRIQEAIYFIKFLRTYAMGPE